MQKVNIGLRPSVYAHVSQILIFWIVTWAVLVSELPLSASLYLLALLIQIVLTEFDPQTMETLQISLSGKIRYRNRQDRCKKAFTLFKPVMIQLTTEQRVVIKVWRDACTKKEYRHLLAMIRLIPEQKRIS